MDCRGTTTTTTATSSEATRNENRVEAGRRSGAEREGVAASGEGMRKTRKRELESMAIANEQQEQWLSPDNGRGV